jgi:hypothetical protein
VVEYLYSSSGNPVKSTGDFSGERHLPVERHTSPERAVGSVQSSSQGQISWSLSIDKEETHQKNKKYQKTLLNSHLPATHK